MKISNDQATVKEGEDSFFFLCAFFHQHPLSRVVHEVKATMALLPQGRQLIGR